MGSYDAYKAEVLAYGRRLLERGYVVGTSGNVSVEIPGENRIAITPSGKDYTELSTDDICIVDYSGTQIEGPHKPSIETGMHLAVYQNRSDVGAVIHTHQVYASIFAVLGQPIPAILDEAALYIGPVVDVVPYAISGSADLAKNVAAKLQNQCHCYLLQNHGVIACGATLAHTFRNIEVLERLAQVCHGALATGKEVTRLPEPVLQVLFHNIRAEQTKAANAKRLSQVEGE